jgi:hypothetical protein
MDIDQKAEQHSSLQKRLNELEEKVTNPVHKRLIQAYKGNDPRKSMEDELGKILIEVLRRED